MVNFEFRMHVCIDLGLSIEAEPFENTGADLFEKIEAAVDKNSVKSHGCLLKIFERRVIWASP